MAQDQGAFFFAAGAIADRDYYPTDGMGGSGETTTGDIDNSHMDDFNTCVLVDLQVSESDAAGGGTITVKDASGTAVDSLELTQAANPVGTVIPLNWKIKHPGGFTVASNDAAFEVVVTYQRIYRNPSSL
jgi:hypothetical protein